MPWLSVKNFKEEVKVGDRVRAFDPITGGYPFIGKINSKKELREISGWDGFKFEVWRNEDES